jgi:Stage II sporulation protein E (SpoIIE)
MERYRTGRSAPQPGDDGTPPTASERAERELDQQAGIVTAASAAVSQHEGSGNATLPGVLAAYTDGLVERPGTDLEAGIHQLGLRVAAAPAGATPRQLCDAAVAGPLDRRDDVALIAVRFG